MDKWRHFVFRNFTGKPHLRKSHHDHELLRFVSGYQFDHTELLNIARDIGIELTSEHAPAIDRLGAFATSVILGKSGARDLMDLMIFSQECREQGERELYAMPDYVRKTVDMVQDAMKKEPALDLGQIPYEGTPYSDPASMIVMETCRFLELAYKRHQASIREEVFPLSGEQYYANRIGPRRWNR